MELNEIKKVFYKNKTVATFNFILGNIAYYKCNILESFGTSEKVKEINFQIPISEMGDAKFENEMEAKHLIRWIVIKKENAHLLELEDIAALEPVAK